MSSRKGLLIFSLTVALLGAILTGCATAGVKLDEDKKPLRAKVYAQAMAPFAAMSALVYTEGCLTNARSMEERGMLETYLTNSTNRWARDCEFKPSNEATNAGLWYEVWVNRSADQTLVAIAIRGTEFTHLNDWKSNFWWLTRYFSKKTQYSIAPATNEIGRIFATYGTNRDTMFITTGHSLGGGLAQTLLYAFPEKVAQCYAFNPSPVTAFAEQTETNRQAYNELLPLAAFPSHRTLRIYEKGEILANLRAQLRYFYPLDDKIMEVRWDFDEKRHAIRNHGIAPLAVRVIETADRTITPAPHRDYKPWWQKTDSIPQGELKGTTALR